MKKLYLICLILIIAVSAVWSQTGGTDTSKDAHFMIINAYSQDVFIRLSNSKNDVLYETDAMPPNDITLMHSTPKTGFYFVDFKYNEADDWQPFYDEEDDDDVMVYLEPELVCCLVIDGYGGIKENPLVLPESDLPLVCFCNISDLKLNRMEIGIDYKNDFVAFTTDISAPGMTDFTPIASGGYGLAWETEAAGANDEYACISNDDDSLKLFQFANNNIYVYGVVNSDASTAILYNITP